MIKEFIPYEQALELKEVDFNEFCFGYYNNKKELTFNINNNPVAKDYIWVGNEIIPIEMILAPTFSQAFRWFREKHNLFSFITTIDVYNQASDSYSFKFCFWLKDVENITMPVCETYEEAELACLKELIEMVKIKTI